MAKSDKRVKSLMDRLLSESKRDISTPESTPGNASVSSTPSTSDTSDTPDTPDTQSGLSTLSTPDLHDKPDKRYTPDIIGKPSNDDVLSVSGISGNLNTLNVHGKSETPDVQRLNSNPNNLSTLSTQALPGTSDNQEKDETFLRIKPLTPDEELIPRTFKLPQSYLDIFDAYAYWERLEKQQLIGEIFFNYFRDKAVKPLPHEKRKIKRKRTKNS